MNSQQALREARALLMVHGLRGWTVTLDNARTRAGRTTYSTRVISLSRYLTEAHSIDEVRNTVLHEIAHALVGPGHGHDEVWRRMFVSIGGNGQRCHTTRLPGRYEGTCPKGHKSYRHRMTKSVKLGASCGQCNPYKFDARYRLVWVDRGVQVR